MSTAKPWTALRSAAQQAWAGRTARERLLLGWGAAVLTLAALWSLAWAPAWRTWQEAPARQAQLDAQTQRMQQLQAQAQSLQKPQALSRSDAVQWLEQNLTTLGPLAQVQVQGERATLRVQAAPAQAMAQWLRLARENAQALPEQAQLQRTSLPAAGPAKGPAVRQATRSSAAASVSAPALAPAPAPSGSGSSEVLWQGTVVLRLP